MESKDYTLLLNNGLEIPQYGIGTFMVSDMEVIKEAIDIGCRHIDCAWRYANEREIGTALAAKLREGTVKRSDVWITSKLWNDFHRPEKVRKVLVEDTLKNLELDYLDLYLMHWPLSYDFPNIPFSDLSEYNMKKSEGEEVDYLDTWKAMEELVDEGLVRSIGVSNFNITQLNNLLNNCRIKPVMNQIEANPCFPNADLIEFSHKKGVKVTAYAPLGAPGHPMCKPGENNLEQQVVLDIARKHGRTAAQILIRFALQRNVCVVPKSSSLKRIRENFQVFDFQLSDEDMTKLLSLGLHHRCWTPSCWSNLKDYPFEDTP